jgi:prepilin-type N-terminal cleavage/methylation domain-containing protein
MSNSVEIRGRNSAFTLIELLIVIAIIALIALIVLPGYFRSRQRAQASQVRNDLRLIEQAVDQYAVETGKKAGDPVAVPDWTNYVMKGTRLYLSGEDALGNEYGSQTVDELPFVPLETYYELGLVADDDFWDPYNP